jgi:hypothetical protein
MGSCAGGFDASIIYLNTIDRSVSILLTHIITGTFNTKLVLISEAKNLNVKFRIIF